MQVNTSRLDLNPIAISPSSKGHTDIHSATEQIQSPAETQSWLSRNRRKISIGMISGLGLATMAGLAYWYGRFSNNQPILVNQDITTPLGLPGPISQNLTDRVIIVNSTNNITNIPLHDHFSSRFLTPFRPEWMITNITANNLDSRNT